MEMIMRSALERYSQLDQQDDRLPISLVAIFLPSSDPDGRKRLGASTELNALVTNLISLRRHHLFSDSEDAVLLLVD
jgi:hypothetical protein